MSFEYILSLNDTDYLDVIATMTRDDIQAFLEKFIAGSYERMPFKIYSARICVERRGESLDLDRLASIARVYNSYLITYVSVKERSILNDVFSWLKSWFF